MLINFPKKNFTIRLSSNAFVVHDDHHWKSVLMKASDVKPKHQ